MADGRFTQLVTIIVPTRNRSALLARLLESFAQLCYPRWEAIIVDDGSTDDTPVVVDQYRAAGLPLTYLRQSWRWMGAARNLGVRYARGEIVAFTDDDCVVSPRWLDAITEALAANHGALGAQGKTVTSHEDVTLWTHQVEKLEPGPPYHTCNIAYRTCVLRELGGFDPKLVRAEDVVMAMRVRERGSIVFAADAVVMHPPRPRDWLGLHEWRMLLESELHFNRVYPQYLPARHPSLAVSSIEDVVLKWLLPEQRTWRLHRRSFCSSPIEYLRHVPFLAYEKLCLVSLLPFYVPAWRKVADSQRKHGTPHPV